MRKKLIKIGKKLINEKSPCFIIAEAGVNHNGNLKIAKKLIDAAKSAGADAVKFQSFSAENLVTETVKLAKYQEKNLGQKETQFKMLKKLEINSKNFLELKKYCDQKKIIFLSTPHTEDVIDWLNPLIPAYKISSGDLTNLPFLKKIARKKKPVILSTGTATLTEVAEAIQVIKQQKNNEIILLHCTTNYPCPLKEVNLKAMLTLKKKFNLPVGFSDHTSGSLASLAAVALGAVVIEKHFTLNKNLPGPDHQASLEPKELKLLIQNIREVEIILGDPKKRPTKSEQKIKKLIRKSLIAGIDITKGTIITQKMIQIKRPGTGLAPKYFSKIRGRKAKKNISKNALIKLDQLY